MPGEPPDIVVRLRARDPSAYAEVFERHRDRLYRLALNVLRDSDDAEDAVQETFITLARRIDGFEGRSELGTWLYRVAYNAALQRIRARRPQVSAEREAPVAEIVADAEAGPEHVVDNLKLRDRLDAAFAELSEPLRSALFLRDVEGLSTEEAADLLGITSSALKVRLHRARLAVRELLSEGALPAATIAAGMSCEEVVRHVSDYLDDALDRDLRIQIEAHVEQCDRCRITLDLTRQTVALVSVRRSVVLPAGRSAEMFAELKRILAARG